MSYACIGCGAAKTITTDSRASPQGVRRRRRCVMCGLRFSTMEMPLERAPDIERMKDVLIKIALMTKGYAK